MNLIFSGNVDIMTESFTQKKALTIAETIYRVVFPISKKKDLRLPKVFKVKYRLLITESASILL